MKSRHCGLGGGGAENEGGTGGWREKAVACFYEGEAPTQTVEDCQARPCSSTPFRPIWINLRG